MKTQVKTNLIKTEMDRKLQNVLSARVNKVGDWQDGGAYCANYISFASSL